MSKREHKTGKTAPGVASSAVSFDSPDELFATCCALLRQGEPDANRLLPMLERFPTFATGWNDLGHTLLRLDQLSAASVAFEQALTARSHPHGALLGKAEVLRRQGRSAEAIEWLSQAATDWAQHADLAHIMGRCRHADGDWSGAETALARSVQLDRSVAPAWFRLGLARQDLRDWPAASEAYEQALRVQPTLFEAALNLGICRQEIGDMEAAMQAYGLAVRRQPACFNRVAQALTSASTGRLWLDLGALRRRLLDAA